MSNPNFKYFLMRAANGYKETVGHGIGNTWQLHGRLAIPVKRLAVVALSGTLLGTVASISSFAVGQDILGQPDFSINSLDVRNRPRPDYDPDGVSVGSFVLHPSLTIGEIFNNNVFATENNESSDFITTYSPSISAVSDWNNHGVAVNAHINGGLYAENSTEDFLDYGFAGGGRLDVLRSTRVTALTSWDHLHEDRGSPEDANGDEPSEYDQFVFGLGGTTRPNRLSLGVEGNYTHFDFENVNDRNGMIINNEDRNQSIWEGMARAGYEFRSDYEIFMQGAYSEIVYDNNPDDNGVNRDSHGWRGDIGVAFDITDTLVGDIYAGYLERSFENPAFQDTSAIDFGADLFWSITPLTTARALVTRNFDETTQTGSSSILQTAGGIEVDHELLRNVIIGGRAGVSNFQYEGISREDNVYRFSADARYLINRNFFGGARAGYTVRDSNVTLESYDQVEVGVFLGAQM